MNQKGFVFPLLIPIVIGLFVIIQLFQYYQEPLSVGGDWSYNVKCPLGTYNRSLNQGPLAGGLCQPYLSPLFDKAFSILSRVWWIPIPTQYLMRKDMNMDNK